MTAPEACIDDELLRGAVHGPADKQELIVQVAKAGLPAAISHRGTDCHSAALRKWDNPAIPSIFPRYTGLLVCSEPQASTGALECTPKHRQQQCSSFALASSTQCEGLGWCSSKPVADSRQAGSHDDGVIVALLTPNARFESPHVPQQL